MKQSLVGLLISFSGSQDGKDVPKWVLAQKSLGTSDLCEYAQLFVLVCLLRRFVKNVFLEHVFSKGAILWQWAT